MTVPSADLVVSFRDASEPRALAARFIASAHRHARGWTVHIPGGPIECRTFDAVAQTVARRTETTTLLIVWVERNR